VGELAFPDSLQLSWGGVAELLPKNWLPTKRWEEVSRGRDGSTVWAKIAHIDPWPLGNQEFIHPKTIVESRTERKVVQTIIVGSERRSGSGVATVGAQLKGARQVAELAEEMGKALDDPKLLRVAEKVRKEERGVRKEVEKHEIVAPVSERFDYYGFITIAEFGDEKLAEQNLENIRLLPMKGPLGLSVSGANLPGVGDKATVLDILKSDRIKGFMTEEQIEEAERVMGEMQREVKENFPKDVKFRKGKYQGADVVVVMGKVRRTTSVGSGYSKEGKDFGKVFHSARVGRFIVSGDLLRAVNAFPLGSSRCDSLHEFEEKTVVTEEAGITSVDTYIRPTKSTFAKEGYLYKEEVDEIFKSLFSALGRSG